MARGVKKDKADKVLTPEERLAAALVPVEEQPYEVPGNWCWVYLGNVSEIIMGQSPEGMATTDDASYIPLIGGAADMGELYPETKRYTKIPTKVSRTDDVIICIRATLGRPIYSDGEYCLGRGVAAIRSKKLIKGFIRYGFMTFEQSLFDNATGTTFGQITNSYLNKMPFPLPPLAEQQRIVDRIESLFAKLDEAKEKAQAVVDGFEDRKAAILHKAFTGELTRKWREKHGVYLGQWVIKKLKDCGKWMGGGTPSMSHPEYWENGDILWITSKDMKSDLIENTMMRMNQEGIMNSTANYCNKPSVLFVMRSGILRRTLPIAMVKKPFTVNQDLKAIAPDEIDIDYLFWACKNKEKQMLKACMKSGTTVESINTAALMEFELPVALKDEQPFIVSTILNLLMKVEQARDNAEQVIKQINDIKKSILARAFRGELGTNDPTDNNAEEQLKQILIKEVSICI